MAEEDKKFSKLILGKTVVSKTGKRFGEVGDIIFETKSGELIHIVLKNPTSYTEKLDLEKDNILVYESQLSLPLGGQPFKGRPGEKADMGKVVLIVPANKCFSVKSELGHYAKPTA